MSASPEPASGVGPGAKPARLAALLFGVHTVLLFFPPIPPDVKGSLWSYVLAYVSVVLGAVAVGRRGPGLAAAWLRLPGARRVGCTVVALATVFVLGVLLQAVLPEVFHRFSREEGVWEPITMFGWIAAAVLLLQAAGSVGDSTERRHLRFLGWSFALLAAEEIDYFGIFGGIIGRVEGIYVGSPHDVIRLWAEGLLTLPVALAVAGVALVLLALLLGLGYLQPRRLLAHLLGPEGLWLLAGALFIGTAQAAEAEFAGFEGLLRFEELIELGGGVCWSLFGIEIAGRAIDGSETRA